MMEVLGDCILDATRICLKGLSTRRVMRATFDSHSALGLLGSCSGPG